MTESGLPACVCGPAWACHNIGTRRGAKVRTACSHASGPRGTSCGCREYSPPVETRKATPHRSERGN